MSRVCPEQPAPTTHAAALSVQPSLDGTPFPWEVAAATGEAPRDWASLQDHVLEKILLGLRDPSKGDLWPNRKVGAWAGGGAAADAPPRLSVRGRTREAAERPLT